MPRSASRSRIRILRCSGLRRRCSSMGRVRGSPWWTPNTDSTPAPSRSAATTGRRGRSSRASRRATSSPRASRRRSQTEARSTSQSPPPARRSEADMTARAHAIVALALLGASGCMVGHNYVRPESPTPSDWGELASRDGAGKSVGSASQPVAATWWTTFDDDRLHSLIERAMRANLDVRQAEARVRKARASRRIAASEFWPHVGASGSAIAERASKNGTGSSGDLSNHLYTVGFDASWEIDAFGGIRRSVELADASVAAAEASRDDALVTLFGDVGLDYVTYRSLQRRIAIADDNLRSQQATLDLTRRLFDAGLSPELDVQRASAQVATTASAIPVLEFQAEH